MFKIDPIPEPECPSDLFAVQINGFAAQAYQARVSRIPFNQVWPGHQRPPEHTELAAFISFDTDETVELSVTPQRSFSNAVIRPLSKKITPRRSGNTLTFRVSPGDMLSLELDGHHQNLHIFANLPLCHPKQRKPDVLYFGPGTHDAGQIVLHDRQTLVIDSGAVVYGSVLIQDAKHVRVCGHGILCNAAQTRTGLCFPSSFLDRKEQMLPDSLQALEAHPEAKTVSSTGCMKIIRSQDVLIEGIIFRDSAEWTATVGNCTDVTFDNVKTIGMWRYNADGIDFCNSSNGVIKNSFLRNFDDNIVVKGLKPFDGMDAKALLFEKNVIWCDWGRGLEIGAETCSDEICGIVFRDTDILHGTYAHMDIQNGDRGHVYDVLYENIRVEYSKYETEPVYQQNDAMQYAPGPTPHMPDLFDAIVMHCYWSQDTSRGKITDITLRDIAVQIDEGLPLPKIGLVGLDAQHSVQGVKIESLTVNGAPVCVPIEKNAFVSDIQLQ